MQAAITFDLDGLQRDPFAREPTPEERLRLHDVAHDIVLPRIASWLRTLNVRATFFSIGSDVRRSPAIYRQLVADGHEVANHTQSHLRDFSRQPSARIRSEIRAAHDTIAANVGVEPVGFRSPGYTVSPGVIAELTDAGYRYDASMMPSWFYCSLKRAFQLLGGRQYRSYLVPQSFRCLLAPRLPYHVAPDNIYRARESARLIEIPITTLGALEFPFIYALTFRLPALLQQTTVSTALRQPFFSLGFHDLEFADRRDFGSLPASSMTRPHLTLPIEERLARMSEMVRFAMHSHQFVTMQHVTVMSRA